MTHTYGLGYLCNCLYNVKVIQNMLYVTQCSEKKLTRVTETAGNN